MTTEVERLELLSLRAENAALKRSYNDVVKVGQDALNEKRKLREALQHSVACILFYDAYRVMKDEPEKITACLGCRDALMTLLRQ